MHILLTGASGFLGKIIEETLRSQHQLDTIDRSASATHRCDLSSSIPALSNYDLVIHAAGKAHVVPKTESEKHSFFQVNLQGTQNLLKALEDKPPATFIFISTVAVYGRDEGHLLSEDLALDGNTPYALSKIKAEEEVKNFGLKQGWKVLILRLPLVVGKNPPGNLGAMIRGIQKGYYFRIGSGETQRSMVLAKDIANWLPSVVNQEGTYHLCGQDHPSFAELEQKIASHYGKKIKRLPIRLVQWLAKLGDHLLWLPLNTYRLSKLTASLTFSDAKARNELNWQPHPILDDDFLI